jgi:glycosyltransferase involved in cell wall biosynthesis
MARASALRVIYIAPRTGASGVGDYADDFLVGVTPHVAEVRQLRHGAPGTESIRDVMRVRRELKAIIDERPGMPTIVHTEQSGGAMTPFWAPVGLRGVPVTSTVHDPPFGVWWPFRTRGLAGSRILNHGIHRPAFPLMNGIERRVNRSRTLFTLTCLGAERLGARMPKSHIIATKPVVPERRDLRPIAQRPLAIGLFGYVYRGKGFEGLKALRDALDPDILIRIAGRGTDKLPRIAGVQILGEVNGADEDAFFDSIRMLAVPYMDRDQYGIEVIVAASTVSRALAYQTPVLTRQYGALTELGDGVVLVDGGVAEMARCANAILRDISSLEGLQSAARITRRREAAPQVARTFLAEWERLSC